MKEAPPLPEFSEEKSNEKKRLLAMKLAKLEGDRSFSDRNQALLPHLYGWKWYSWARAFYESKNQINLLCAANQISKSSTQIRKCIEWATNQELWPSLWRRKPVQFWYLYPSQPVVNAECMTKWTQFLPIGEMRNDARYGWKWIKDGRDYIGIEFHSGVYVFFKTYAKSAANLQTGTCDAIFCDEELPFDLYDELVFRVSASDGYFHMVFTATLGQDEWRRAMEPEENDVEFLPQAFKQTVSLYDAMKYEDGSPSDWTAEKIAGVRARCGTEAEVQKRVYGRFIVIGGRTYEAFDVMRHLKPKHPVPASWQIYGGVDYGSGGRFDDGRKSHPSAIVFVAVSPDHKNGRVFLGWRGDEETTTQGDVVKKFIKMKRDHNLFPVDQRYDWSAADFFTIATSMGESFNKANKSHDVGIPLINTLFKNNMLYIYEDGELGKLAAELVSLKSTTLKRNAKDDFADALRYCVATIPWDFSGIGSAKTEEELSLTSQAPEVKLTPEQQEVKDRREAFFGDGEQDEYGAEAELSEWNDLYGS